MARILVFGAGGYIGIPLCEALEKAGHWVQAADRFFFGKYPKLSSSPPLHADIRTYTCGEGLFDVVIDVAGLSNDASAEIDQDLTRLINLHGAMRLAEMAKQIGVKKYVYASSCSVYGAGRHQWLKETDECRPLTLYAACKAQVEDYLRDLEDNDFKPVILRNATVFGIAPRMRFDLAVNIMTLRAQRDRVIYVMGGGEQTRPFVHIADVVEAFRLAAGLANGGTFNIGTENLSISRLAALVALYNEGATVHRIPDDVDRRDYHVSFKKSVTLGWRAAVGVGAGIVGIRNALEMGEIQDGETCYTLQWYKKLMEWDDRLANIRLDGRIL